MEDEYMKYDDKLFLSVEDVAEIMDISVPTAYKVIQKMNKEMRETTGKWTMNGRVNSKFFYEHFYGTDKN